VANAGEETENTTVGVFELSKLKRVTDCDDKVGGIVITDRTEVTRPYTWIIYKKTDREVRRCENVTTERRENKKCDGCSMATSDLMRGVGRRRTGSNLQTNG
jgi:hypothetical protein